MQENPIFVLQCKRKKEKEKAQQHLCHSAHRWAHPDAAAAQSSPVLQHWERQPKASTSRSSVGRWIINTELFFRICLSTPHFSMLSSSEARALSQPRTAGCFPFAISSTVTPQQLSTHLQSVAQPSPNKARDSVHMSTHTARTGWQPRGPQSLPAGVCLLTPVTQRQAGSRYEFKLKAVIA